MEQVKTEEATGTTKEERDENAERNQSFKSGSECSAIRGEI